MKIATKQVDVESSVVTFHFANGKKLVCIIDDLPAEMVTRLALHGASQKVGDSYAAATENGWSVDDCFAEASAVWQNLIDGTWSDRAGRVSGVVAAMAEVFGKEYDECLAVWGKLDAKAKRAVAKDPKIVKHLAERELANVKGQKSTLDVGALFAAKA